MGYWELLLIKIIERLYSWHKDGQKDLWTCTERPKSHPNIHRYLIYDNELYYKATGGSRHQWRIHKLKVFTFVKYQEKACQSHSEIAQHKPAINIPTRTAKTKTMLNTSGDGE